MNQTEFTERYLKFMRDFEAKLPADMPEHERRQEVLAALEDFFAQDVQSIADQSEDDLQHLFDNAIVGVETGAEEQNQQLATVRQTL